jgi:hypothetical protein
MSDIDESVSGFKRRGGWVDVVEHGERITQALRELAEDEDVTTAVPGDPLEAFDEWRPKSHERIADVNEKTAEKASVDEGKGEKEGKPPDEDLKTAGEKLADSYENLDEPSDAVESWGESIDHVARGADSAGRKALRAVEDKVYRNVMTKVSPYYFDNELVSANIKRINGDDRPEYVFEINVNDDDLKEWVSNRLADYDVSVDRWHVNTEKETDAVAAAEGVEVPDDAEIDDDEKDTDAKTN